MKKEINNLNKNGETMKDKMLKIISLVDLAFSQKSFIYIIREKPDSSQIFLEFPIGAAINSRINDYILGFKQSPVETLINSPKRYDFQELTRHKIETAGSIKAALEDVKYARFSLDTSPMLSSKALSLNPFVIGALMDEENNKNISVMKDLLTLYLNNETPYDHLIFDVKTLEINDILYSQRERSNLKTKIPNYMFFITQDSVVLKGPFNIHEEVIFHDLKSLELLYHPNTTIINLFKDILENNKD